MQTLASMTSAQVELTAFVKLVMQHLDAHVAIIAGLSGTALPAVVAVHGELAHLFPMYSLSMGLLQRTVTTPS